MSEKNPINIKKFIDEGTKEASLQDLQQKGFQKVKVLDEKAIQDLISRAIDRIVVTQTSEEKQRVLAASRQELDRLMKEQREMKTRAELSAAEKSELIERVEKLQKENTLIQDLQQRTIQKTVKDAVASLQKNLEESRTRVQQLQQENTASQAELEVLRAEYERHEEEAEAFRTAGAQLRGELAGEQKRAEALQKVNADLRTRVAAAEASRQESSDLRTRLVEAEALQEANVELQARVAAAESLKKDNAELRERLKATDALKRDNADLRVRLEALDELKKENEALQKQLDKADADNVKLRAAGEKESPEMERLRKTIAQLQEEVACEKERANEAALRERKNLEWKVKEATDKLESGMRASKQARDDYDRLNSQVMRLMHEVQAFKTQNEKLKEELEKAKEAESAALAASEALGGDKGKWKYSTMRIGADEEGIPTKSHGAWELVTMVFEPDGTRALLYRAPK